MKSRRRGEADHRWHLREKGFNGGIDVSGGPGPQVEEFDDVTDGWRIVFA